MTITNDTGLSNRTVEAQEAGEANCLRNAADATTSYDAEHWMERAAFHATSAAFLRGEAVDTVPLALVETDLGVSYGHANCENPAESKWYTLPVCRCQYTHSYGFVAFDNGLLVSVKRGEYLVKL
jgi:hypothetical protein